MSYHLCWIPEKESCAALITHLANWMASQRAACIHEQRCGNCSRIITPFIPLSDWTVSPQWLIQEGFVPVKKIPKKNPQNLIPEDLRERISSVKGYRQFDHRCSSVKGNFWHRHQGPHAKYMCVGTPVQTDWHLQDLWDSRRIRSSSLWRRWKIPLTILCVCLSSSTCYILSSKRRYQQREDILACFGWSPHLHKTVLGLRRAWEVELSIGFRPRPGSGR